MRQTHVLQAVVDRAQRNGRVITRREALAAGANGRQLTDLVACGILLRPHPGVYVLAGATGDHRVEVRAAIAGVSAGSRGSTGTGTGTGTGLHSTSVAMASHGTAAWLQGICEHPPASIHLTTPLAWRRQLDHVVVHRTSQMIRSIPYHGIRCTPPALTLIDLAALSPPNVIERAVDRALANGVVRLRDIEEGLRHPWARKRGAGYLRICLAERGYVGAPNPSVLESDMARLAKRMGLPVPKAEVHAGPDGRYRIDFVFPGSRLAVEVYGYTWHHSPEQLTGDMGRQRRLTLEGWTVLVYTWQDVQRDPERVAAEIMAALGGEAQAC